MVKRLTSVLLLALMLSFPWTAVSAQVTFSDKHYRLAAWSFYLQQPAQALEVLQLAPAQDERTRLLEAGLYLQLDMPGQAAKVLDALLAQPNVSPGALPQSLRNVALLQFSRYQLEVGDKTSARAYLNQVSITADDAWLGQQQLLNQLVNWPDISVPVTPDIRRLAHQPEMPYIISNQALILAKNQQSAAALDWLQQLQNQLVVNEEQNFWQLLFSGQYRLLALERGYIYPAQERESLSDYIALLQAQLHIERQEFAAADAILTNFAADSVLSANALTLYSHILTEQRHIPTLLAVLQQQVKQQPFTPTAWQAATRIGEQLERALQPKDALAAYHWAQQYYQQQTTLIEQQARPLEVSQLQHELSPWQQLQLSSDNSLYRLQQDILALQQQLAEAPLRQQRLAQLEQVSGFKLQQQATLLSSQLPALSARKTALQQQYAALAQHISTAEQQPMVLQLWQGEPYAQLSRLERAEQRLLLLQQHQHKGSAGYAERLKRLRALLYWQYNDSAAERQWQRKRAQQQVAEALQTVEQQLDALILQGGKTPRLEKVQQRLKTLTVQQQQLNLALLSRQQQLLAELNQQLQQRRQQQLASLTELVRHNKESMARVMERVLLTTDTTAAEAGL